MFSRYGNTNIKMIRMKNNVSYKHFLHTINFMGHICRINTLGYAILDLIKQAFLYSFVKFSGFLFLMFIYIMYFTISFYPLHCFRGRGHCTLSGARSALRYFSVACAGSRTCRRVRYRMQSKISSSFRSLRLRERSLP